MKIAYIMSRFPKITETFILYEILELVTRGIAVEIYPLLRQHEPRVHPEVAKVMARVHYQPFLSLEVIKAHGHYLGRRPRAYLRTAVEVLGGTLGGARFFKGALGAFVKAVWLAAEFERQGITHIHAHFASHPTVAALIVHRLTAIPFSFTAHGSDIHKDQRLFDRKIAAAAFAVMISDYNKEFLLKKFGRPIAAKMIVNHCGIDPAIFRPAIGQPGGAGEFTILCVASFKEVKGHRFLLEACRLLQERGLAFICHLIGDGPLRGALEKQRARAGLTDKIIMHGPLPQAEVVKMLQQAAVVVQPSVLAAKGDREGIPVALMEAMACGRPVIASRLSGIPELVEHGRTGLLVPPGDSSALTAALAELKGNPALGARLGKAGREKVRRDFNLHTNTARLAELFLKTAASGPGTGAGAGL